MTGTPTDIVLTEDIGAVRVVTFNRPERLNAFNAAMYNRVGAVLDEARDDEKIRVVVLTGAGRAFSAGQDLGELAALAATQAHGDGTDRAAQTAKGFTANAVEDASGFTALLDALRRFDKPLLAAVNGVGVGIGCTILPHCDIVLVAEGARLRTPFAELGVSAEAASSYLFPKRMGWQRAAVMLFASEWMDAQGAVDAGLALEVVPADRVLDATLERAQAIAVAPMATLRAIKGLMLAAEADAVTAARAREDTAFAAVLRTFTT